jgi:competence protein ComEA
MKKILFALFVFVSFSLNALAGVNINTATQAELESLNGIGPVKAKAIIDYRKKNGDFKSVDDLEKVDGVGAVTLQNVRKEVSVNGKTTVVVPAAKADDKKPMAKETKPAKDTTKSVGTEKAATSGKAADTKEVKATADKKTTKAEDKATAKKDTSVKAKADAKADVKVSDTKVKADTKTETKAKKPTKAEKAAADKKE